MKQFIEVAAIVLMNVVSVVGVVAVNRIVFRSGFHWASTLMCFHSLCTWAIVSLAQKLQWFQEKRLTWPVYAKLGIAQIAYVGFVNLSLKYSTVSTYRLLELSDIMMICIIEFLWKSKSYSRQIYAALGCLVIGVSVATLARVEFSIVDLCVGIAGSTSAAVHLILSKATQSDHEVGALQLLQYEQPWTALFAAMLACLVTDDVATLLAYSPSSSMVGLILLSGIFACGVNVSRYLIIGKTSPITYSVVGHAKTVGFLLFVYLQEPTTARDTFGLFVAFAGILWYTHLATTGRPPTPKKTDDHVTASSGPPPQIECTVATELAPLVKRSDNVASAVAIPHAVPR